MAKKTTPQCGVVILAAGHGKRMHSSVPKALNLIAGRPMLIQLLETLSQAIPHASVAIVVGVGRQEVEKTIRAHSVFSRMDISFVHQKNQLGTGDAAREAMESPWGEKIAQLRVPTLVLPGDFPLLTKELLSEVSVALGRGTALRVLTCDLPDPTSYGRIVRRGKKGGVLRIVEHRDASVRELKITEVATSIYLFNTAFLRAGLKKLNTRNSQAEYYLTDLVSQASCQKKKIDVLNWPAVEELRGVNTLWELSEAEETLRLRMMRDWALTGVRFTQAASTCIDADVEIEPQVTIGPGVVLKGKTKIGRGSVLEANVHLQDTIVGEDVHVKAGSYAQEAVIGDRVQLGPYAHLRPHSEVGEGCKVGNFVELKKSRIGKNTNISHLSYLGDAEVGSNVNIGCGFITCNFDGRVIDGNRKHPTIIEDGVFMGSDCQTVAPVRIGKESYIASGSTIVRDVPTDALAIARSKQVNKEGYAKRFRPSKDGEKK